MDIPRTLVVTNDFPPGSVASSGRSSRSAGSFPAAKVSVIAPSCEGSEAFDESGGVRRRQGAKSVRVADALVRRSRGGRGRTDGRRGGPVRRRVPAGAARVPSRLAGTPYVVLAHGFDYWLSTVPVANGCDEADDLASLARGGVQRVHLTTGPNGRASPGARLGPASGADVERFRPDLPTADIRERHGLGDRPLVVCVSRLVPRKGQDVLIRAMRAVQRRVPEAALLIVGSGPYEARSGASPSGRRPGRCPSRARSRRTICPGYYAVGDVFAMPCRTRLAGLEVEGWGNVFIEAAACGRPVVVGDSGGSREALVHGETGLLVDGKDVAGWPTRVATLLEDPAYAQPAGQGGSGAGRAGPHVAPDRRAARRLAPRGRGRPEARLHGNGRGRVRWPPWMTPNAAPTAARS